MFYTCYIFYYLGPILGTTQRNDKSKVHKLYSTPWFAFTMILHDNFAFVVVAVVLKIVMACRLCIALIILFLIMIHL